MRITTARYYTPSGRSIQAKGIEPDVEVKPAKLEVLESGGFGMSEADLRGALKNENAGEDKSKDTSDNNQDDDMLKDYQLMRAVDMVKGLGLYSKKD